MGGRTEEWREASCGGVEGGIKMIAGKVRRNVRKDRRNRNCK